MAPSGRDMRRYKLFLLVGDKPCGCKRAPSCSHPRRPLLVPIGRALGGEELASIEAEIGERLFRDRGRTLHRRHGTLARMMRA